MPGINATSTADISFMLLVFFLITTSIDSGKGIYRRLTSNETTSEIAMDVKQRNVLHIKIDANDSITVNGQPAAYSSLQKKIEQFVDNKGNDAQLPEITVAEIPLMGRQRISASHVIVVTADSTSTYNTYIQIQDAITAAYGNLRSQLAARHFGKPYANCSAEERQSIAMCYPQRISELQPKEEGGGK